MLRVCSEKKEAGMIDIYLVEQNGQTFEMVSIEGAAVYLRMSFTDFVTWLGEHPQITRYQRTEDGPRFLAKHDLDPYRVTC